MSDKANTPEQDGSSTRPVRESVDTTAGSSRRRMLKKGVGLAPVVLTLASRPVLAWQCKSPSAWGSEQLDSATSLATNDGHRSYRDETWRISNWKDNSSRASLGQPWVRLGFSLDKNSDRYWKKIRVSTIKAMGFVFPGTVDGNTKMVDFLGGGGHGGGGQVSGTEFQKMVVVAQLNASLLSSVRQCISVVELGKMASGAYSPPHLSDTWYEDDIKRYLQTNYIAVP